MLELLTRQRVSQDKDGNQAEGATESMPIEASSWCKARSILAALTSLAWKLPMPGTLIFLFLLVLVWLLDPSPSLSSSSSSLAEATYSGSSPSEPELVAGDAVGEVLGDDDIASDLVERRRLRVTDG